MSTPTKWMVTTQSLSHWTDWTRQSPLPLHYRTIKWTTMYCRVLVWEMERCLNRQSAKDKLGTCRTPWEWESARGGGGGGGGGGGISHGNIHENEHMKVSHSNTVWLGIYSSFMLTIGASIGDVNMGEWRAGVKWFELGHSVLARQHWNALTLSEITSNSLRKIPIENR